MRGRVSGTTRAVIPGWCVSIRPGISRFSDVQLHIIARCGACHRAALCAEPLASPRNDGLNSLPLVFRPARPFRMADDPLDYLVLLEKRVERARILHDASPDTSLKPRPFDAARPSGTARPD